MDAHQLQFGKLNNRWDYCSPAIRGVCPPFAGQVNAALAARMSADKAAKLAAEEAAKKAAALAQAQASPAAGDGATASPVSPAATLPSLRRDASPARPQGPSRTAAQVLQAAGCTPIPGKSGRYACSARDGFNLCERLRAGGEIQGCESTARGRLKP